MDSFTSQSSSCPSDSESSGSVHSQNSQDIVDCEVARSYLFEPYATDNGERSGGEESISGESDGVSERLQNTDW